MSDLNNIEKLFQDKLQNFEIPVRAELWDKVAAGAGIGKTVFWTGTKIVAAAFVGGVAVFAICWFSLNIDSSTETSLPLEQASSVNRATYDVDIDEQESFVDKIELSNTVSKPNIDAPVRNYSNVRLDESLLNPPIEIENPMIFIEQRVPEMPLDSEKDPVADELVVIDFEPAPEEILDLELLIAPDKTEEKSLEQIHFPEQFVQVFNPTLPGESGQFSVYSENLGTFKIEIRTRSGKLVYTSTDANFVWRGQGIDGSDAPEGTYLYTIFSTTQEGEPIKPLAGSFFLMRK